MADTAQLPAEGSVPVTDQAPTLLPAKVVEAYSAMIADVPEAGGDGMAPILLALAQADHPDDLDAPWRSTGMEDLVNVPLLIQGIRKMPSDYPGGLPWFLVVDAAIIATGELVTFTTGAVSVVAQLAKAHALGAFPWRVIPRQSDRPSKAGYYPQHLEVIPQATNGKS